MDAFILVFIGLVVGVFVIGLWFLTIRWMEDRRMGSKGRTRDGLKDLKKW